MAGKDLMQLLRRGSPVILEVPGPHVVVCHAGMFRGPNPDGNYGIEYLQIFDPYPGQNASTMIPFDWQVGGRRQWYRSYTFNMMTPVFRPALR